MVTNVAASVIDKLKNIAKENNKAFNVISILYYQERLDFSSRRISNNAVTLESILTDICKLQPDDVENDGIVFHSDKIQHQIIKEDAKYEGVRITIPCSLGNMKNAASGYWFW